MGKEAPHILVTTPESLYILLTAEKSREMLRSVRTLIVDEIHAVADDKRGSHLALSIARLEALVGAAVAEDRLVGDGEPIEEVARFLSPKAHIVQVGHRREMELAVEVPRDELGAVASTEMWGEIYDRIAELARENRTTLVFVNTRRLSERVAHHLGERLGENAVLPHHGSLSRQLRLEAEQRLKNGRTARGRGDGVARIGDRYRHGGPGVPDRLAALDRGGAAAHRPRGALGGRAAEGPPLRDHAR